MKCSRCRFAARSIKAMGQHYRKKHPKVLRSIKGRATRMIETVRSELEQAHGHHGGSRRPKWCPICAMRDLLENHGH